MHHPRGAALVRFALVALAFLSVRPAAARAQDVLCDPGEKEVHAVRFEGNSTFSDDELSARVLTTPSSLTRRYLSKIGINRGGARRCFPDIGLATDVANLKAHYKNNGFYDTKVDTVVTPVSKDALDVTFRITEGQPLILDSLAITGLDAVPERERILRDSILKVGSRAGIVQVISEVDSITTRLRNSGYPKATVFQRFDTHPMDHRAVAELNVEPGARAKFGRIAVKSVGVNGDAPQIDSSVVRDLLGFKTGDLYSDRALNDAQRSLYNLSTFRHVGIAVDTAWAHGDSIADIDVDLREDFMRQVDLEEGWATLDCFRVNALYTDKNFQDKARRFELTARLSKLGYGEPTQSRFTKNLCYRRLLDKDSLASSKVNDYFGATVRTPTFFGRGFSPAYSVYTERKGQYQAFLRSTDVGLGVSGTRDIAPATPFRIGYTFEHGSTRAEPVILCALFNRCSRDEQDEVQRRQALGIGSASLQRSTTDNPVAPTRGYLLATEARYSTPYLASDATLKFFKLTGDVAWYHQLLTRVTFAARARGGLIAGGQAAGGTKLPPPQERLYAGGPTSVRGFQQNELGPQVYLLDSNAVDVKHLTDSTSTYVAKPDARPDRAIPGGGNLLAVFNVELRIRDPFLPDLLEYVPFIDAGQVWINQIGKADVNRAPLAVTPGLSVRYFSPVGPIQVNVGYNRYPPRPGPAYFLTGPTQKNRPLICVTAPGVTPLVVTSRNGELIQDVASCPASFVPSQSSNFFKHLKLTLSIGTDF